MKKLNLFAVGLIAMLTASSVNAQIVEDSTIKTCLESSLSDITECKLNSDITISSADFNVVGTKTIDLNGHTLTMNNKALVIKGDITITNGKLVAKTGNTDYRVLEVKEGATLTTKNIDIITPINSKTSQNGEKGSIYVFGGNTANSNQTTVNIEAGTNVTAYAGLIVVPSDYADVGTSTSHNAYNVEINLNDGKFETVEYSVQVNGLVKNAKNIIVNVNGGTYTSSGSIALYAAGVSDWTIKDGTIAKGIGAVQAKGGNVTIDGGIFEAVVGTFKGTNADNKKAAVSLLDDNNYSDNASLVINGGTFTSEDGPVVDIDGNNVKPEINDGYFEAKNTSSSAVHSTNATKFIKGGVFVSKRSSGVFNGNDMLAEGLSEAVDAEGNTVVGKKYTVTIKSLSAVSGVSTYNKLDKFEAVVGERIDLYRKLNVTGSPSDRNYQYAVKYILNPVSKAKAVTGTVTGLDKFTMPESDVELILEIVEVKIDDYKAGEDVIPSTPGTDPTPGGPTNPDEPGRDPEAGEKLPENQPTGDNVMGSVAMGIAGLVGIVGSALVFDKKTNYNN